MPDIIMFVFIVALGLALGSFANVCIYRMPRGLSVVRPRSFCVSCSAPVRWFHNIPIVSWLALRGRCADCGAGISGVYPAVEAASALLFAGLFLKFGATANFIVAALLGWVLIVVAVIDLGHRIIPDELSLGLVAAGILLSRFNPFLAVSGPPRVKAVFSLVGAMAGFVGGAAVAYAGEKIFRKEAFGGGDIKLMSALGAFLGARGVFWSLFAGSAVGSAVSLVLIAAKKIGRSDYVPFGPFLAAGALLFVFLS